MSPHEAYYKASISGYTRELEEIACKYPRYAYLFARDIPGANIKYCQEHACKKPKYACWFADNIPGADIKYCQENACKDHRWAYFFALYVPGADLNYCLEACKEKKWHAKIQVLIMNEALL